MVTLQYLVKPGYDSFEKACHSTIKSKAYAKDTDQYSFCAI